MPCVENWSFKPLDIIQNIYDNRKENEDFVELVEKYFSQRLNNCCILTTLPSINDIPTHNLQSGMLVSFRCMVQETFEPEYFVETFEVVHKVNGNKMTCTTAYKDSIDCPSEFDLVENAETKTGCRQVLYCVTIPGETPWVKKKYHCFCQSSASSNASSSGFNIGKRSLEDDDEIMDHDEQLPNGDDPNKKHKSSAAPPDEKHGLSLKKNHPLPDETGPVCIVKVYGEEREFKINEVHEFVGILSLDPLLAHNGIEVADGSIDAASLEEHRAHHPPPSFVPRIHCVHMTKLKHNNPILYLNGISSSSLRSNIKNEIKAFLQKATLGDDLAAEYLLLHLVSRVYSRTGAMAVGKFSLNISNVPTQINYTKLLFQFLNQLLTKIFHLPMTLHNLNNMTFIPSKNYSTNRLDSGLLQLSDGTHLFVDESVLVPGHLDANGVKHVQALSNLINFQKVDYNFQFHPLVFHHDIPALILSDGKSLLPCDCQLPLLPVGDIPDNLEEHFARINPSSDMLDKFRAYLTETRLADYELSSEMMKVIENDFVAARQRSDDKMTADDLHTQLIVARLLSITCGVNHLTLEAWKTVGKLESERKSRLVR